MPSRAGYEALQAIQLNIALARRFVEGMTFEAFVADPKTLYAVTRCLEIISEAARRLDDSVRERHAHIEWRAIMAAGNIYRHQYADVTETLIWRTVSSSLGDLSIVIELELASNG